MVKMWDLIEEVRDAVELAVEEEKEEERPESVKLGSASRAVGGDILVVVVDNGR